MIGCGVSNFDHLLIFLGMYTLPYTSEAVRLCPGGSGQGAGRGRYRRGTGDAGREWVGREMARAPRSYSQGGGIQKISKMTL